MWDRLRALWTGESVPDEPVVVDVPGPFGSCTVTGHWHPRRTDVTASGLPALSFRERHERHRRWARLTPPPRIFPGDRHGIVLDVDGLEAPLDCGRRALRRATYHVHATIGGRTFRLRQRSSNRAVLERDGEPLVTLIRGGDRPWVERREPAADSLDVLAAVALGCVLGIGAPGVVRNLLASWI